MREERWLVHLFANTFISLSLNGEDSAFPAMGMEQNQIDEPQILTEEPVFGEVTLRGKKTKQNKNFII